MERRGEAAALNRAFGIQWVSSQRSSALTMNAPRTSRSMLHRLFLLLVVALSCALPSVAPVGAASMTIAEAAPVVYDAPVSTSSAVHGRDGVSDAPWPSGSREGSAQTFVEGRGGSTTSSANFVATEAAPFGEIGPAGSPGSLRTVIGKTGDLEAPGAIGSGERTLLDSLPNQGSPRANWAQNDGVLRQEMGRGMPIRDASVNPVTGALETNTGFLAAERNLLQSRGWTFDPKTTMWSPPR